MLDIFALVSNAIISNKELETTPSGSESYIRHKDFRPDFGLLTLSVTLRVPPPGF